MKQHSRLKAIIFDMDGVLTDSTKYIWESFNILLKDIGVQFSDKDIKRYLGLSLRDKLKIWSREYGIREFNLEEFSREAGEIELELMKKKLHPDKALNRFLQQARKKGIKLAVATYSLRWRAEKILELLGIKNKFEVVITSEDVENHKPSPDLFLEAARQLRVEPGDCVVFDDAPVGIVAARRAGMKVITVKTESIPKDDLGEADMIIRDFSRIDVDGLEKMFNCI